MTAVAPFHLAGERLMLDPAGAVYWPERRLLAVSDLHLEKGSSYARRGMLLPPWDSRATLERLFVLLRRWQPQILVLLGDSFHDQDAPTRLAREEASRLHALAAGLRLIWVRGNHDPLPPDGLGGEATEVFALGPLVFRHQATAKPEGGEVSGHYHPKATIAARGTGICRPCFVADARRVLMPAFGAYTGGLDVGDPAILRLFPRGGRVFLLGEGRLFGFALHAAR
ncbi:MAG TPA: ligase-associated DNA damage response endonuclease PdeM [Acetobacteraceae bacterium]|nr:ligase-associated DNA damage response endonuclease PdeM [Acetobacteraceae bacterium]